MAFMKRKSAAPAQPAEKPADAPEMGADIPESHTYSLVVPEIQSVNLENVRISQEVLALIPESIALANHMLPLYLTDRGTTLVVAMENPRNDDAINNIGVYTGLNLEARRAPGEMISEKIRELYTTQRAFAAAKELVGTNVKEETTDDSNDESVPIIRFVNNMIEQAVIMKASDIHIEPHEDMLRIRFRIDGKMVVYMDTEAELAPSVSSRIKFIAGLNIAERRIPQDGRINYNYGKGTVDLRISILPGAFGETIVIRITTALSFKLNKHSIGFTPENLMLFDQLIRKSHGLILLTGPTGSGKTTTLYAALSEINKPDVNIITVEDPVEMIMDNLTQVEVNAKTGLTFATVMRSILRQDPDIVMVGEIRDEETAKIAMTLSITGHLVFSTLHTFDSPSAVMRLIDMGVEPYMAFSALSAVISQRLVRKVCPHCSYLYDASVEEKKMLHLHEDDQVKLVSNQGCEECNYTGYIGRTAVHEILIMSPAIRDNLASGGNTESIRKIAREEGMKTLFDNLRELVLNGTTTVSEMKRTYSEFD